MDRQRERERDRRRHTDRLTDRQAKRKIDKQIGRQTDRLTHQLIKKQAKTREAKPHNGLASLRINNVKLAKELCSKRQRTNIENARKQMSKQTKRQIE